MNGAATISPLHQLSLCKCGHDRRVHTLPGSGNQVCTGCVNPITGATQNVHNFTPYGELWPSDQFPTPPPAGTVCAGGFGTQFTRTTTASGNGPGVTTVNFTAGSPAIVAGMTFFTLAPNANNSKSYRIIRAVGNQVTITPALTFTTNSAVCVFAGAFGSTMGPALPPNGQRAG